MTSLNIKAVVVTGVENKIEAIKAVRTLSALSLKDAKDFVENITDNRVRSRLDVTNHDVVAVEDAIKRLSAAGFEVTPAAGDGDPYLEYRTHTRKMIAVALEDNNVPFARTLLDFYEKYLSE